MVEWNLGTIGFTYPEWKGSLYPAGLPSVQSLNYYSKLFNAVEINTTFYGAQPPAQLQRWQSHTHPNFCFCLKAPKRVTHELSLAGTAAVEMHQFLDSLRALDGQLGAVLLQMPPSFNADAFDTLMRFLEQIARDHQEPFVRCALEVRHASWYAPAQAQRLTALLAALGMGWVATDYEDLPLALHVTGPWVYFRWIGKHNGIAHPGYEVIDRSVRLSEWLTLLRPHLDRLDTVFGFFDNDYAGHAPASVQRLKLMLGLPDTPGMLQQGRLF